MSALDAAADGLVSYAEGLRPVFAVADALKELGSLDNALSERRNAYQAAVATHEDMRVKIDNANAILRDLKAQEDAALKQTNDMIQGLADDAAAQRVAILEAAQKQASDLIAAASVEITRIQQDHAAIMAINQQALDRLQVQVSDSAKSLSMVQQATVDAEAKLETIQAAAKSILAP